MRIPAAAALAVDPPSLGLESLARALSAIEERVRLCLVVDDEPLILGSLERALRRRGFGVKTASSAVEALRMMDDGHVPDVLLTDQRMPGMTGVSLLEATRRRFPGVVRLAMSGYADRDEIVAAINSGAVFRYLLKPWNVEDLYGALDAAVKESDERRESDALRTFLAEENRRLLSVRSHLEGAVRSREDEIATERSRADVALLDTVRALASSIEAKDRYTAGHSELVSRFSVALAEEVGLHGAALQALRLGGVLHDIGKLGVPDAVLLKPGKLTPDEYEAMKAHAEIGARIVAGIHFPYEILPIVRSHHERWDGKGYPDGTAGEETPLLARITHVVDVYEAVTARRVYRDPMPAERVVELFDKGRGTEFDPALVDPFLRLLQDGTFDRIRHEARLDVPQETCRFSFQEVDLAFERRVD